MQKDREHARRSSRARSTRGQENEAWALYKKIHPGSPGVTFLGTDTSFAQSHPRQLKIQLNPETIICRDPDPGSFSICEIY